jgi:hypothetical protein
MDWPTIKVLTKSLKGLLAELDAGTHVEKPDDDSVKES